MGCRDASDDGSEEEPTPTSMRLQAKAGGLEEGKVSWMNMLNTRKEEERTYGTGAEGRCERIQRSRGGLLMGWKSLRVPVFKVSDEK